MSDPLAVWVGSCRDTRFGERSSPRSWSEFWTCCITLGKSLPCFCLHPHSKLCPSAARPCHSLCCGGAQGQGLHGGRASVSESRVVGTWMWGLDVQWHHQLLGSGRRGCAGALLLGTRGARLCSCPREGMFTTAGGWCLPGRGGESRASSGPHQPSHSLSLLSWPHQFPGLGAAKGTADRAIRRKPLSRFDAWFLLTLKKPVGLRQLCAEVPMYTEATGRAARLLLALGRSTGLSLSQWGRRCSDQVLCDADNLCQLGQPGHLLPGRPLPVACAYISSMYSTVVRRPCSVPAAALPGRHECSPVLVGQLK